jgi:hypothetical protein
MAKNTADQDMLAAIGSSLLDYAREVGERRRRRQDMELFELEADVEIAAPVPQGSMLAVIGSDQSPWSFGAPRTTVQSASVSAPSASRITAFRA